MSQVKVCQKTSHSSGLIKPL